VDDSAIPTRTTLSTGRAGTTAQTPFTPQTPSTPLVPSASAGPPRPQRGAAQGQTYQQFCQGFNSTSHDSLTVDSVAGNTVAVTIVAEHADGSSQTYRGSYVVGNGVIQSASVQASS
jgi:hypothetical protein